MGDEPEHEPEVESPGALMHTTTTSTERRAEDLWWWVEDGEEAAIGKRRGRASLTAGQAQ